MRSPSGRNTIDLYLDRAKRHPRLTPEQERECLVELRDLRRRRWLALCSRPSALPSLLERIEPASASLPQDLVDEVRSRCIEDSATPSASGDDRRALIDTLATALEASDTDGELADALTDDLPDDLPAVVTTQADRESYHQRVQQATAAYFRARNRFVCANLRLVLSVVTRYSERWMSLADRVQEGNLGLIKATERFELEHGTRFSTYAVWWIRHAVTRALVNRGRTVRIPAHLHSIFVKLRKARPSLEARFGRPATLRELSAELDIPVDKLEDATAAMELRAVPLGGEADDDGGSGWLEQLGVPAPQSQLDTHLEQQRDQAIALQAMEHLAPRERHILEHRFGLQECGHMTLEALGHSHSVSRERIRQLQNRALRTLRRAIESSSRPDLALA